MRTGPGTPSADRCAAGATAPRRRGDVLVAEHHRAGGRLDQPQERTSEGALAAARTRRRCRASRCAIQVERHVRDSLSRSRPDGGSTPARIGNSLTRFRPAGPERPATPLSGAGVDHSDRDVVTPSPRQSTYELGSPMAPARVRSVDRAPASGRIRRAHRSMRVDAPRSERAPGRRIQQARRVARNRHAVTSLTPSRSGIELSSARVYGFDDS